MFKWWYIWPHDLNRYRIYIVYLLSELNEACQWKWIHWIAICLLIQKKPYHFNRACAFISTGSSFPNIFFLFSVFSLNKLHLINACLTIFSHGRWVVCCVVRPLLNPLGEMEFFFLLLNAFSVFSKWNDWIWLLSFVQINFIGFWLLSQFSNRVPSGSP